MSLSIRLTRAGARKKPFYRVVVADKRMPRDGRFIEKIGYYNPLLAEKSERVTLDGERAQHWIARGAQPSRRVALFLHQIGIGEKPAIPKQTKKSLPRKKELERREAALKAKEEKTETKVEEKTEAKTEEKTEEKVEAKTEEKTETKVEEKTEAKTEEKVEAKTEEKVEANTEEKQDDSEKPVADG